MISDKLRECTIRFAKEIQALLNGTIARHVQMKAVALPGRDDDRLFVLGHLINKKTITPQRFPLKPRAPKAELWMDVSYQLRLDAEREHLMVQQSFFGVFGSQDAKRGLFHYDYERNKAKYPDAHLQVYGHSELFSKLNDPREDPGRSLAQLHFPVGGKRFRPCLEDVIEFLIVERLVVARDGAEKILEASRDGFRRNQLLAAMRRDPEAVELFVSRYGLPGAVPS